MRIYEDLRVIQARISVCQYGTLLVFSFLALAFWHLQVVRGHHFRTLAENNRTRSISVAAPRGPVLDRRGAALVENRPSFNIILRPDDASDLDRSISNLAGLLKMSEAGIRERIARRGARFRPVLVKADATGEDVASVEARKLELPEVDVEPVPLRSYPLGSAAAHTLGTVGEISERQLQSAAFEGFDSGDLVGQSGLELRYNRRLMGQDGLRRVFVNSRGVEVGEAEFRPPTDGPSLTLTLNVELQQIVEQALVGKAGCVVALEPTTGEILAMASSPAFDPNAFSTGLDPTSWGLLSRDPATPLMNRTIQGQYAPGSLFKIVIASAALEEHVITPETTFNCPGYIYLYDRVFHCHIASGHGPVNLQKALAQSCNVYFYQVGVRLEIDRIARYARLMGLGEATGVDLPDEKPGLVPSRAWKLQAQNTPWYAGETVSVAIGQGQVKVTPLQMVRVASIIANGGRLVRPHLVKSEGGQPKSIPAAADLGLQPATVAAVKAGLYAVVNQRGSGWRAQVPGLGVCGKTGTAQVVSRERLLRLGQEEGAQPHGWFVGFAPADQPTLALAVLIEHGGSSAAAAPVAREIFARFLAPQAALAGVPPAAGPPNVDD